jgi:hypothetical protein
MLELIRRFLRYPIMLPAFLVAFPICRFGKFKKYKHHLLSSWFNSDKRTALDNILFPIVCAYWFRFEYLRESDPDKRESLKNLLMGGESGKRWAAYYNDQQLDFTGKFTTISLGEAYPTLPYLHKELSALHDHAIVIQVGSSSGKEVAWLAQKHPEHTFIGSDIYPEVVSYAAGKYKHANLTFLLESAKEISKIAGAHSGKIYVFASGSLQYVQPEHLQTFFNSLSHIKDLEIVLLEPGNDSKGNPMKLTGSLWRGNFSYTHNYKYYAEKAGFSLIRCEIIRPYPANKISPHQHTIHYFFVCRSI